MSKVVKGFGKGLKKVGKFVKKNWKPIAMAAAVAFTGGLATVGFAGLKGAIAAKGILGGIGSTMWAGATAAAGTLGIGSGAMGTAAAASGMTGAGLFSGALAGALGMPTVAGTAGGTLQAGLNTAYGAAGLTAPSVGAKTVAGANALTSGLGGGSALQSALSGGGGGRGRGLLSSVAPYLLQGAGAYFLNKSEQEAAKPDALWGADFNGGGVHQPWDQNPAANPMYVQRGPNMELFSPADRPMSPLDPRLNPHGGSQYG